MLRPRWRFTVGEARIKLEKVYPVMDALDEGEDEEEQGEMND